MQRLSFGRYFFGYIFYDVRLSWTVRIARERVGGSEQGTVSSAVHIPG